MTDAIAISEAALQGLIPRLERDPNRENGGFLAWVLYYAAIRTASKAIRGKWLDFPFAEREKLRQLANTLSRSIEVFDQDPAYYPTTFWVSPIDCIGMFILLRSGKNLIALIRKEGAEEDRRASAVIERYQAAPSQEFTGEYVTLTDDQIRSRAC
jgi:hypothetical protein